VAGCCLGCDDACVSAREASRQADLVAQGHAALEQAAWDDAYRLFAEAVACGERGDALDGLAWAAWWRGDAHGLLDARRRAYRAYRDEGSFRDAARVATWLGTDVVDFRGDLAVAQGWFGRARSLLDASDPYPELGWLFVHEAEKHLLYGGRIAEARSLAAQANRLGRELGDVDLEMMGLAMAGLAAVMSGDLDDGTARLSEAATAALAEELSHRWAIYWCVCLVIHACEVVRDHDRASQWCRGLQDWSERLGLDAFNRSCRAYHAGVLIWRGEWSEAESELVASAERLTEVRPPFAVEAWVRLGELRRRQGRLDEAAALFEQAVGHDLAVLGAGELCLDRNDPAGARDRAHECLRALSAEAVAARTAALELLIRAETRLGDLGSAEQAAAELRAVVRVAPTEALQASAAHCEGLLASAKGEHDAARVAFEDAARLYQRSGAPFEQARARIALAHTLVELGRCADALSHARTVADALERMGARGEADAADALVRQIEGRSPVSPLTPREREVLRLVAEGRTNRAIAEHLVVSTHTVNRHVTNILTKLDVGTRSAAVAEAMRRELI
jgi:ATP/maltotriose-dependent transcriptional regulator MalT